VATTTVPLSATQLAEFPAHTPVQWLPRFAQGVAMFGTVTALTYPGMGDGYRTVHCPDGLDYCVHVTRLFPLAASAASA